MTDYNRSLKFIRAYLKHTTQQGAIHSAGPENSIDALAGAPVNPHYHAPIPARYRLSFRREMLFRGVLGPDYCEYIRQMPYNRLRQMLLAAAMNARPQR